MAESSILQRALAVAFDNPNTEPVTTLPPPPPALPESAKAALKKCRAAWQRAFNQAMEGTDGGRIDRSFAARDAAQAYCAAMPVLVGSSGIRDFLACAAYGILIGAIPPDRSGQILYAAQIALNALPRDSRS